LHNKFITIIGDRQIFDPLFNYEYHRKFIENQEKEEKRNEDYKEEENEDKNKDKYKEKAKQVCIKNFEREMLNFKTLRKRNPKQNIRKLPNSYYGHFMNKSGYANNSNSFSEKSNSNFSFKNTVKESQVKSNSKQGFYNTAYNFKNENENANENRLKDFMTAEVNDAKINNLRKQQEENKEAYFGRRTIALDEHVKNKRTYIEEFSVTKFFSSLFYCYSKKNSFSILLYFYFYQTKIFILLAAA